MFQSLKSFRSQHPVATDLAVLLAGGLYPLAFSPFNWWPFAVVTLAVLVFAVAEAGVWRGALRFYLFAVGMYGVGVSWIYVSIHEHGGAGVLLAAFLVAAFVLSFSLFSLIHGWLYMRFVRPAPMGLTLGFAIAWLLREWTLTWALTGFPWLFAGYAPIDTWLAGYAPVAGVLGVGFVLVLQASLIGWVLERPVKRNAAIASAVILLLWCGGWGLWQVHFVEPTGKSITVSAVQGDIDQNEKWLPSMVEPIIEKYLSLTRSEWGRDLVVWPEAAITLFRGQALDLLDDLNAVGKRTGTTLVLGIPQRSPDGRFYNTAVAVGNGSGTYIKRHLVPFGEYVPFEKELRGLITFFNLPMSDDEPGPPNQAPMHAGKLTLSLSICYEVVYPELVRTTVEHPDLFITISNDTWFGHSIGPWQHFEMARMRALENGRYMVRATNNGVTGIIDQRGRVVRRLPQFEAGVLRGKVKEFKGRTPFSRFGGGPLLILAAVVLTGMLISRLRHVSVQPIR